MNTQNIIFSLIFFFIVQLQAQQKSPSTSEQVETLVEAFIEEHYKTFNINPDAIMGTDGELSVTELKEKRAHQYKLNLLRDLFFQKYPEYRTVYQFANFKDSSGGCINPGFEDGSNGYSFFRHQYDSTDPTEIALEFMHCIMEVNQDTPIVPGALNDPLADVALVSPGNDPLLLNLGVSLNRVNNGSRAIRINDEESGANIVTMQKNLTITEESLVFNFAAVFQNPNDGQHTNDQPFFQIKVKKENGDVAIDECIISNEEDCIFMDANPNGSVPVLYTNWSCVYLNTSELIDQNVTIEFIVADCGLSGHYGYVYLDDICDEECSNPLFGNIDLDPLPKGCPEFPLDICGTYISPLQGTQQQGTLTDIELTILDDTGPVYFSNIPSELTSSTFCFEVQATDLPNLEDDYEVMVQAWFLLDCGIPYTIELEDVSSNPGPDISFEDCCDEVTCPDISITKSASGFGDPIVFNPGQVINYVIEIENHDPPGTCPVSFTVRDLLDDTVLDLSSFSTFYPGVTELNNARFFPVNNLEPGEVVSIPFSIQIYNPVAAEEITNCVNVIVPSGCNPIVDCVSYAISCDGDNLPMNLGADISGKPFNEVVLDSQGYVYVLFDGLNPVSPQLESLATGDFTEGTFLFKFNADQCLVDYIELSSVAENGGRMQIGFDDHLYIHLHNSERLIKLNSNLETIWTITLSSDENINDGNINFESVSSAGGFTTGKLVYGYNDVGAKLNGQYIVSPLPFTPKGPLVAHLNKNDGTLLDHYYFEATGQTDSAIYRGADAIEVTKDFFFVHGSIETPLGGNLQFNGSHSLSNGWNYFIAKFNILGGTLVPDLIIFFDQPKRRTLEFDDINNVLYVGDSAGITTYDEDLNLLSSSATLSGQIGDMVFNHDTQTLVLTYTSTATLNVPYVVAFSTNLGIPIWEKFEGFDVIEEGIFHPRIASKGSNVYLSGTYLTDVTMNNGLPPSIGTDLFIEWIDTNNPPQPIGEGWQLTKDYKVAPNPSSHLVKVTLNDSTIDITGSIIYVRDFFGRTIMRKSKMNLPVELNVSQLNEGIYFIEIRKPGKTSEIHKLIVQH